jgi:hypothetical protein
MTTGDCWYGFSEPGKAAGFYPTYKKVSGSAHALSEKSFC